ncbi:hypothetical protein TRAPUB_3544 [Trametes pubescens]|uniref:Uncharacterized protein n=1 Tax=Trametes pubescens TaxID=154538 RepID=A0A1M2VD84_TRAPU|nr:hypothetical protein TRAPUB_3544 [Trametes pubescens]
MGTYNSKPIRSSRQLPQEVVEEIFVEAWKATSDALERQDLYASLEAAHPALAEIIERVAVRFVMLETLGPSKRSDGALYSDILNKIELLQHTAAGGEPPRTVAQRFGGSHVRMDAQRLLLELDQVHRFEYSPTSLRPILNIVTSITLYSSTEQRRVGVATEVVYRLLARLPHLTHLHLDFDMDHERFTLPDGSYHYGGGMPVPLPSLTFLRTRTCPGCGWASMSSHAPECLRAAFAQIFPKLRELQLDTPIFLKYFDAPPTLECVTLNAPPPAKLFCSIQGYNVAAGLRRWMEPRPEEARGRSRRVRLKKIVVHTGKEEPIGWQQAQEACDRFGVRFVREVLYL